MAYNGSTITPSTLLDIALICRDETFYGFFVCHNYSVVFYLKVDVNISIKGLCHFSIIYSFDALISAIAFSTSSIVIIEAISSGRLSFTALSILYSSNFSDSVRTHLALPKFSSLLS